MDLYEFIPTLKGLVIILELHTILKKRQYGCYTTNNEQFNPTPSAQRVILKAVIVYFTFQTSSSSIWQCGITNQQARGLEMNQTHFFMRCQDGNYYNDKDQIESWGRSGNATSLIPRKYNPKNISSQGWSIL